MVYLNCEIIYNSTFNEDVNNSSKKRIWHSSCGSASISSIGDSFDPTEIKDIVESLVMSKFGSQYNKRFLKSSSRKSKSQITSCSSFSNESTTSSYNNFQISKKKSDYSINTSNVSDLISNVRPSTTCGLANVDDVLRYLDTCISSVDNSSMSELSEEIFESEELKINNDSSNLSLELLNRKKLILIQTREQILKAIYYHERNRLSLHRERLEAEKLLLITDAKVESLYFEIEELTCVENINSFCSGSVEIFNMHLFPKHYHDQHFVCLVTFGSKVFASEISKMKSNGVIYFNKKFAISSLQPNFKLQLRIYSAFSKILKKSSKSQGLCDYSDYNREEDVPFRKSIFSLWGEADIELSHLSRTGNLQIQMNSGLFTACISSQADVNMSLSGFLNVNRTSRTYPSWDRQFCCLNEGFLYFYNYPPKELCKTTPTYVINLETCELTVPSREDCPKKHSICLNINTHDCVLISFDTQHEFDCWSKYLNIVLSQIRTWNQC